MSKTLTKNRVRKEIQPLLGKVGEMAEEAKENMGVGVGRDIIQKVLSVVIGVGALLHVIRRLFPFKYGVLWITSPSGKTTKALPFYLAMRIIRQHGWYLAKVEPMKPRRVISRIEAVHILLFGDDK